MARSALIACCLLFAADVSAAEPTTRATTPADVSALTAKLDAANARIANLQDELAALRRKLDGADEQAKQAADAAATAAEARVANAEARVATAQAAAATAQARAAPIRDDGNANTLKRIAAEHVKIGMPAADVVAILGEPKEKRRDGDASIYVWKRADLGHQGHGAFVPGPKVTIELAFDDGGSLRSIRSGDR